jgi:hypothetical protein
MTNKKYTIILATILLTGAAVFVVNAAGIVLFGGDYSRGTGDGLILDIKLSQANYTSGTKVFADASGNGNNGTSANAATFMADSYGNNNRAMNFNGTTDNVFRNSVALGSSATFESWGYATSLSGNRMLWNHQSNSSPTYYDFYFSSGLILLNAADSANNPFKDANNVNVPSSIITLNKWYHYVVVVDAVLNKAILYINGEQVGTAIYRNPTTTTARLLYIGGPTSYRWQGAIANMKIYNRALSALEVRNLYKPRVAASSLQSGLVGYWPLDGDNYNATTGQVTDKTPYSNNCTNSGATLTTDRTGRSNGALEFNGATSYLSCGNGDSLKITGDQTYAFWIYPHSFSERRNPIHKAYNGEGTITLETSGGFNYYWGTGGAYTNDSSVSSIPLNQWTHVVHVRDLTNNRMVWYLNGASNATATPAYAAAVASANNLTIGDGYVFPIDGALSDIRVYNRALSESEINTLYGAYRPKIISDSLQQGLILDMPLTANWVKTETAGSQIMTDKTPYSRDSQNNSATISSDGASFNGSSNWVSIPYGAGIDPSVTPMTFSMWVKPNVLTDAMFFSASYSPRLYIGVQGGDWEMGIQNSSWGSGPTDVTTNWTHVVVTMDGANAKMYINGTYDHQKAYTAYNFLANFNVGRTPAGSYYFNGSVANLKIYNRALSAAEVISLYDKGRL